MNYKVMNLEVCLYVKNMSNFELWIILLIFEKCAFIQCIAFFHVPFSVSNFKVEKWGVNGFALLRLSHHRCILIFCILCYIELKGCGTLLY